MKINKLVSILIPTLNRSDLLISTVGHLANQSHGNHEIIIVDQSDVPLGESDINRFPKGRTKYFHLKEKGLPNARNFAIRQSGGDILLFLDDDVIPHRDLVLEHCRGYDEEGIGCIAGRVVEEDKSELKTTCSRKPFPL